MSATVALCATAAWNRWTREGPDASATLAEYNAANGSNLKLDDPRAPWLAKADTILRVIAGKEA